LSVNVAPNGESEEIKNTNEKLEESARYAFVLEETEEN
jgi:hypothetical protein